MDSDLTDRKPATRSDVSGAPREKEVELFRAEELEEGEIRGAVLPNGRRVAVYNVDGQFFATDDLCTHGEASLSEDGLLEGPIVECAWHGGAFDVTTGEVKKHPCTIPLKIYPVMLREGIISVKLEEEDSR